MIISLIKFNATKLTLDIEFWICYRRDTGKLFTIWLDKLNGKSNEGDEIMSKQKNLSISRETSQRVLNSREHLNEIISLLVNVDNQAVEDQLLTSMETTELTNLIEVEEITENPEFEPIIYCIKTGQQIDYWSDNRIGQLIQTIGKERAIEIIKMQSKNRVADHWIFTDDKALEKLVETDPIGYYVYALTHVLEWLHIPNGDRLVQRDNEEYKKELYAKKAIVYRQANKIPLITIIRVNELMRRYLSITQTQSALTHLAFAETRMEYVTHSETDLENFEHGIQITLSNLIKYEVSRGRLKPNLTYQEVVDLKLIYKGHSNFRNQKRLQSMTEIEHTLYLIKDFMADMTPTMVQIKTPEKSIPSNAYTHIGELTLNTEKTKPRKINFGNLLQRKD